MSGKFGPCINKKKSPFGRLGLPVKPVFLQLATTFLLVFSVTNLFAQFSGSGNNQGAFGGNRGGARGSSGAEFTKDSSRDTLSKEVYIYYADNAEKKESFQDSTLLNFHIYDPTRQAEYEHVHLGNLGSAHRPLVYQPRFHKGFDAGYHNYELYLTKPEDIPYYNLEKVYSDIYFSQTSQDKTALNANVGKPIGQRTNLGIYYRNIRNQGEYTNQEARTNAFSATIDHESKNQKHRSFFSVTTNTIQQRENGGGVLDDPNFTIALIPQGRPVQTETGQSRYFERDINYTQFYLLQKTPKLKVPEPTKEDSLRALVTAVKDTLPVPDSIKVQQATEDSLRASVTTVKDTLPVLDSIKVQQPTKVPPPPTKGAKNKPSIGDKGKPSTPPNRQKATTPAPPQVAVPQLPKTGRKFTLKHNLSLKNNTYRYSDIDTSAYFDDFVQDDRGVRNFIETNQIENTFSIRTFKLDKENESSLYGTDIAEEIEQKDLIEAGITHLYTDLFQEPFDSSINNVFLFGKVQFTPSDRLKINTYAHLGIADHAGDYYLKGDFFWDTKKLGRIDLSFINQFYRPSLIQQRFISTQTTIWDNDFNQINETTLSAKYALPKLKIDLAAHYHFIDNFIYNDTLARPTQFDGKLNIFQLIAKNKIDVWRFHLQNTVYFQTNFDNDILRFPEIYSIHRLYLDLKLFKVMETELGGEVRLNSPYRPDNFQPLTAQFFQQETEIELYPVIDLFFNFRIQQFRFFLVAENLWNLNRQADFHFNTYSYAIPDFQARFGFRWLFLD